MQTSSGKPAGNDPSSDAPFFQAVFAAKNVQIKTFADMAGKTVAVTRGAMEDQELNKVAPAKVDYRRFDDNNATIAAYAAGDRGGTGFR